MGSDPQLNKVILQYGRLKCLFTSKAIALQQIIKSLMCHRTASTVMLQSAVLFFKKRVGVGVFFFFFPALVFKGQEEEEE